MSYLLCIETSTTNCSVAIAKKGRLIALKEDNSSGYSHGESLHIFIETTLQIAGITLNDLSAIAVSKGPGSYTGLRIGVSAAKGLCYSLKIPLIAINTLEILAQKISVLEQDQYIVPMLDARRMEVYTAIFTTTYKLIAPTKALILEPSSFNEILNTSKTTFIGNGVAKFKKICEHPNATFIENTLPSAKELCVLSYEKFNCKDFENVAYFEPYYLKDFIAGKPKNKKVT